MPKTFGRAVSTPVIISVVAIVIVLAAAGGYAIMKLSGGSTTSISVTSQTSANQAGGHSFTTFSSISNAPAQVQLSGNVVTTGHGTHATSATFTGKSGTFTSAISNSLFSITLPNFQTYYVTIDWSGNYSWQKGTYSSQYVVDESQTSGLSNSWSVPTPNSLLIVSGTVQTSGSGTSPTAIIFKGSDAGLITQNVSGGQYTVRLPNLETYSVSIAWKGRYSWQSGTITEPNLVLNQNATNTVTRAWSLLTPNSQVLVSGAVSTTGKGTQPTSVSFTSNPGGTFTATISNSKYSIDLPNNLTYSVSVSWSGSFSWQKGIVNYELNLTASAGVSNETNDLSGVPTPDSTVVVTGSVSTSGQGTTANSISFSSGVAGSFSASINNGQYSTALPNEATYSVSVAWAGQYSWQTGSVAGSQFVLNQKPDAASTVTENFNGLPTPNSQIVVSGSIQAEGSGTSAVTITFTGTAGTYTKQVSNNQCQLTLPNMASYTVTISWVGSYSWQGGSQNYQFQLSSSPGTSSVTQNWQVSSPDSTVTVTGSVTTSGQGTQPTSIVFSSGEAGTISATISGGEYFVTLPNTVAYDVEVAWTGAYSWQSGTVSDGQIVLSVPAGSGSQSESFLQVPTPNSSITVSGTVSTSGFGTSPDEIEFTASNGEVFSAQVLSGDYTVALPNLMTYSVHVHWHTIINSGWSSSCQGNNPLSLQVPAGLSTNTEDYASC